MVSLEGMVSTFTGSTEAYADGIGSLVQFNTPWGIAVDANGMIYVADQVNHRIRKIHRTRLISQVES